MRPDFFALRKSHKRRTLHATATLGRQRNCPLSEIKFGSRLLSNYFGSGTIYLSLYHLLHITLGTGG
ncbi:uncharacterized protein Dsimw501_GD27936 [Drosophila simulans]|uniref:Uncharacterized protein n=1 Tax=Drosophila simulans TaxID=7240 RepID=A0A0J9R6T4_DROSI|nr:uncharacterized protein Dsimw501_GD27936 [Drosophila simulans]